MKALLQQLLKLFAKEKGVSVPPKSPKLQIDNKPGCKTNCKLVKLAKSPDKRHNPCKMKGNDPTKDQNTMIDPETDLAPDIDAINRGDFVREGEDYIVGERRYGYHLDTGSVYPKSGPGFVVVNISY